MSGTITTYRERWEREANAEPDTSITPSSCLVHEMTEGGFGIAEGFLFFQDFGDAVAYYCYHRLAAELRPDADADVPVSWVMEHEAQQPIKAEGHGPYWTQRERQQRYAQGVQELISLLARFVHDGYSPDMRTQLTELLNRTLIDYKVDKVFVLPTDVDELLATYDNPLIDYDVYGDEEEARAKAPAFHLDDPAHREALQEQLEMIGQ